MEGFPLPDLDFDDEDDYGESSQLMPSPMPSSIHALTDDERTDICESNGITLGSETPLRCTSNSAVYEAYSTDDNNMRYAIKITEHKKRVRDEFDRIRMMESEQISSPFFVKTINFYESPTKAMLQMELCERGDISDYNFVAEDESRIWHLIHDIGTALHILHSRGLMHLDVSPGNILMTDHHFKLADFGTLTKINFFSEGDEGAGPYVSPEALAFPNGPRVTSATDIFSFGVVLLEAASGKSAPRGGCQGYAKIRNGEIRLGHGAYQTPFSQHLCNLVNAMLDPCPDRRPSAEQIVYESIKHCE
ncbi:CAMK family protein kinase [Histomonas meleagridis]|uniref:CAMK family protein kinase n=1 Tax=Histomonas meleagridis TaxID=135588 RepID=UPI00355956E3|nr:CAMK family protein kinase [Histomonas meleagridis]KAH0801332.1 CAMK family protein kinase [Histomonas meleagridis]